MRIIEHLRTAPTVLTGEGLKKRLSVADLVTLDKPVFDVSEVADQIIESMEMTPDDDRSVVQFTAKGKEVLHMKPREPYRTSGMLIEEIRRVELAGAAT